jgi:hypothetical protein
MPGMIQSWNILVDLTWKEIFLGILTFLYSIAHYFGIVVVHFLAKVLPATKVPTDLVDPIGYLILLTVFLAIVEVGKKFAWVVVFVGWALMLVRICLWLFGY